MDRVADALWTALDQLNQSFAEAVEKLWVLHKSDPQTYVEAVKYLSSLQPVQVSFCHRFYIYFLN
jgi:phosphomevalonate kinase